MAQTHKRRVARNDAPPVSGLTLDYKTAFLGACSLVVILGGGLVGYWNSNNQDAIESNREVNVAQWRRLADLDATVRKLEADHEWLTREQVAQDERLRALERFGGH